MFMLEFALVQVEYRTIDNGIHLQTSPHRIDIDNCLFSRYETSLLSTVYTTLFEVIPGAVGAFSEKVELISYAKGMSR